MKFYVAPVKAQAILGVYVVKRVCALQPELLTKETIRDNNLGRYYITIVDNCTPVSNHLNFFAFTCYSIGK